MPTTPTPEPDPAPPPGDPTAQVPALRTRRDVPEYHVPDGWKGTGPLPQESAHIRRSVWQLPLVAVTFMVGLWSIMYLWPQGSGAPQGPHDLTTQLIMLNQAFHGAGVTPIEGDRAALARGLKARLGSDARVPDLRAAGLAALGARTVDMGGAGNMGLIRYGGRGAGPDVLAVFAPKGRIGVPEGSVERPLGGASVWLQSEPSARIVYAESGGLDWALVSARDGDALLAVAAALLRNP